MAENLKKEERKEQIKNTAIKLICKNGYKNTSIQDIIDDLNYSKGGFYNCYKSKLELFSDILNDATNYRYEELKSHKSKNNSLDRKSYIIEALLDKILVYHDYKKIFSILTIEMQHDKDLKKTYKDLTKKFTKQFISFCKSEGFEEYLKITNEEIGTFISSLIIGVDIFNKYDNKEYRAMLRKNISAYFEEINLFTK